MSFPEGKSPWGGSNTRHTAKPYASTLRVDMDLQSTTLPTELQGVE